jgi:hypothetical protein
VQSSFGVQGLHLKKSRGPLRIDDLVVHGELAVSVSWSRRTDNPRLIVEATRRPAGSRAIKLLRRLSS